MLENVDSSELLRQKRGSRRAGGDDSWFGGGDSAKVERGDAVLR